VKDKGFKFLLDFHYSDTWADPGKQYKPMSWRDLNNTQLIEKVRTYTKESVQKFADAGAKPDMVQVGNEVVGGMIHPDGQGNAAGFARLVNAGINGVKDVDPNIKIMMHTISERNPNSWLATLKSNLNSVESGAASKIDVIGLSYYPKWHGDRDSLRRCLTAIANNHNIKIVVAEYADYHREVNDIVRNLPGGKGAGAFVWEPQEFEGDDSKPLFDWRSGANSGRYSNSRLLLYPVMAEDYGLTGNTGVRDNAIKPALGKNIAAARNGLNLRVGNKAIIKIYTLDGQEIRKINLARGDHSVKFNDLPRGVYMANIVIDGEKRTLRVPVR
jgi:arabinogalactan endo-1,4-beta-galactosidase